MADAATIEIRGLDALRRELGNDAAFKREIIAALEKSTEIVHDRLSSYTQTDPPRLPNQVYVRTFALQESIDAHVFRDDLEGVVATDLEYAPRVMGHESQEPLFAGRWWTEKSVAEEMLPKVVEEFEEAADKVAARISGGIMGKVV